MKPKHSSRRDELKARMLSSLQSREQQFDFRASGDGAGNGFCEGTFSVAGELDSYWTVAHPRSRGYSAEGIQEFIDTGYFFGNHDSGDAPIGWIESAQMDGRKLGGRCPYHSTSEAQDFRTVAMERQAAGKQIGLSIGFEVSKFEFFENGEALIKHLTDTNEDLTLWNLPQLQAHDDWCWIMWIERIREVSQVNFQSNEPSVVDSVRSGREQTLGEVLARMAAKGVRMSEDEILEAARDAGVLEAQKVEGGDEDAGEIVTDDQLDRANAFFETAKPRR